MNKEKLDRIKHKKEIFENKSRDSFDDGYLEALDWVLSVIYGPIKI